MRWFQGGIAEAIATSKARNAVFVVFVHGKDEVSQDTTRVVNSQGVSSKLESENFVAITLDSDSEAYRQFAQIYHLVPVPSLFFIGENGLPLEVIAGRIDEAELVRRIESVLEKNKEKSKPENKHSEPVNQAENVVLQNAAKEETENHTQVASVEPVASSSTAASSSVEATAEVQTSEPKKETSPDPVALSTEEKVDRAKDLLEAKRKQKEEEDEEKQRQKEIERRKTGQDVQKLRRWQQDQELKQLKEERQREKAEEAAARERILKQIAQDRAERAARSSVEKKVAEQEVKKPFQESTSTSNVSRIQFRLPDGSAHSHNFEPTTTLAEVRTYTVTELNLPFREFVMSTTFPRREFTAADNNQTLRDLQLVPTAVILILPTSSGAVVTSSSESYSMMLSRMVMSFFTPLFSIFTYLRNLVFGGGGGSTGAAASGGTVGATALGANFGLNNLRKGPSSQNSTGARRRNPADSSVHRQGNIHRLSNHRDSSDDENNTWNGNSTQQM